MIDTVLFDIGGTLLTQRRDHQRTVNYARYIIYRLSEHGIRIDTQPEEFAQILNSRAEEYKHLGERTCREYPSVQVWRDFFLKDYGIGVDLPAPLAEELSFTYDYIRLDNRPREGLLGMSEKLASMGMKLGIVTNTISKTFAAHMLKEYHVEKYYQDIVTSCEFGIRKPDPDIFNHAMERIGSVKETTCYVGDTISRDVLGSRNAGLALVIRINNPSIAHRDAGFQGPDAPKPDFTIDRLDEIPQIIGRFNRKEKT
ncbi:MAG: HAD family hydrolase [Spirochaetales bacterium]|nr:HAD family hydrolase [Spirochaetales bacterium]